MKNPLNKKIRIESREIEGEQWIKFDKEFDKMRYFRGNLISLLLLLVLTIALVLLFAKVLPYLSLLKTNPCRLCENLGYMCSVMS